MRNNEEELPMSIPFKINISEDRIIRGNLFPAKEQAQAAVIIVHGYKGFKDWGFFPHAAQKLSEAALDVITFNLSHNGVGENSETFEELDKFAQDTYSNDVEDLNILIQHWRENKLSPSTGEGNHIGHSEVNEGKKDAITLPLFLLGHSRGAGVSLIYSFDHPEEISGVISWNGITNVDLLSEEAKKEMREKGRTYITNARTKQEMPLDKIILDDMEANQERFHILERVKESSTPIIAIQGTEDFAHLRKGTEKLLANNSSIQHVEIDGGNHTFGAVHPFVGEPEPLRQAIEATKDFIKQTINDN